MKTISEEAAGKKTSSFERVRLSLSNRWPLLRYLSLAFYSAWILLAVTSSEAVSLLDQQSAGWLQGWLYLSSGFALTACLLLSGVFADRVEKAVERGPLVTIAGLVASVSTFILMGGFGVEIPPVVFIVFGVGTGIGTSFVCLRAGFITSRLNGVEAAAMVAFAALVANLLFFTCQALPPAAAIWAISLLPLLSALSSLFSGGEGESGPEPDDLIDSKLLPKGYFPRLICTVFVFALAAGVAKGLAASLYSSEVIWGAKQSTWEVLFSFIAVGLFLLGLAVTAAFKNVDLSKLYMPVGFATAAGMLLCPVLGGFLPVQGIVVNVLYNVFILTVWCWLIELAGRTTLGPVRVFGFGRGASALATTLGWAIVMYAETHIEDTSPLYTAFFLVMAFALVLMMVLVLNERTVSEALAKTVARDVGISNAESPIRSSKVEAEYEDVWTRACAEIADEVKLTAREAEVFALLSKGRSISFIADELVIAPNTVKGYTKNIYAKVGIHSRQELINLTEFRITAGQK